LIGKAIALLLLVILATSAYVYGDHCFAGYLFPRVLPRAYVEMISAAIAGGVAAALLCAYPLARLFGRHAWIAAGVAALPLIILRMSDILFYWSRDEPRNLAMSWIELFVLLVALQLGTWLVGRRVR
jgi:hypothetical protein